MNLNKEQHEKLVEDFKSIIDYLQNNVISKIVTDIKFQLDNGIDVIISPGEKYWFEINRNGIYFTASGYKDTFYIKDDSVGFDLFDGINDDILYQFIKYWDFIKERSQIAIDSTKQIKNTINNFSVENNANTSNMKIYLIQQVDKSGYFQIKIKDKDFFLNKETAINKLHQYFNEQTKRCKQYCYNIVEWRNEKKFIIRDSRDPASVYQIFEIVEREVNVQ